jgi:hypothetical protein
MSREEHEEKIRRSTDWSDRAQVLSVVTENGERLEYADTLLRGDREVVLAAVTGYPGGYGRALKFASEELRNDCNVALAAVTARGEALEFAGTTPKSSREVVVAAVRQSGYAISFAHPKFGNDAEIALLALGNLYALPNRAFNVLADSLKTNLQFLRQACDVNADILKLLSPELRKSLGSSILESARRELDLLVPTARLFSQPPYHGCYTEYEFVPGKLRLRTEFWLGAAGLEGSMALWIRPVDYDQECLGWSRSAGEADLWVFLNLMVVPSGPEYAAPKLLIFFAANTFFDSDLGVVATIDLAGCSLPRWGTNGYLDCSGTTWSASVGILEILALHLGAEVYLPPTSSPK